MDFKMIFKRLKPMRILFSQTQLTILKECKITNSEDNFQWFTKNVVLPLVIILMPLLFHFIVPSEIKNFRELIFNGSISLIGINILFGMSTYLIKVNRTNHSPNTSSEIQKQENNSDDRRFERLNQDVINLRERLDNYKNILVFIGGAFYVIQVGYSITNYSFAFYTFIALLAIVLLLSIKIGRYMFIIKDDFFERTYYGEINEPVIQARDGWEQKYS